MQNRGSSTCSERPRIVILESGGIRECLSIIMKSHFVDSITLTGDLQKVMFARSVIVDVVDTLVAAVMVLLRLMSTSGKGQLEFAANRRKRDFFICFG